MNSHCIFKLLQTTLLVASVKPFKSSVILHSFSKTNNLHLNSLKNLPIPKGSSASLLLSSAFSSSRLAMSSTPPNGNFDSIPSWSDLIAKSGDQPVGSVLTDEIALRKEGRGSPHVQSNLRLFDSKDASKPKITLYRDHAGWCPYCEKTMLLIEEKKIPINIELVPMRSYGDKPREFMRIVPSGLLPAITVETNDGKKQAITESQVIMELLDRWHSPSDGYKPMLPLEGDTDGKARFDKLSRLERELFSWWCTLMFRPEGSKIGGGIINMITGKKSDENMSGSMKGFLESMSKVDKELLSTPGPWFFGDNDFPTMIDFVFVSHVERMLASCAHWKGLDLRCDEMKKEYPGLNTWLDAFEMKEYYLAFKSDYYTNVMDIPPQYGPAFKGGFEDNQSEYFKIVIGTHGSWTLPLPHDDPLQPLYRGPPLPLCVLKAAGIAANNEGSYESAEPDIMATTCRQMAGWKLSGNGVNICRFAARGGSQGAKNMRKTFGAELADPYAKSDDSVIPHVDAVLRIVCQALLDDETTEHMDYLATLTDSLKRSVPKNKSKDVSKSLAYLRDRIGVPRDLPLAAARHLRAHLNWAIDLLDLGEM